MSNEHKTLSVTWDWQLGAELALATTIYRNEFHRDWFKLSKGGDLVAAANAGDTYAQAVLDGEQDVFGLSYKHNNRRYVSEGIQTNLNWDWGEHNSFKESFSGIERWEITKCCPIRTASPGTSMGAFHSLFPVPSAMTKADRSFPLLN